MPFAPEPFVIDNYRVILILIDPSTKMAHFSNESAAESNIFLFKARVWLSVVLRDGLVLVMWEENETLQVEKTKQNRLQQSLSL